jgi:6-phosphogluconolactonase
LEPFDQAAAYIAGQVRQAVRKRGRCDLVLSGGRTPRAVYEQLAEAGAAALWERVRWFWGDERFVPSDHEASNYRMALEALLERVRPPAQNVYPMPVEAPSPEEAARRYERTLRGLFPGVDFPVFDLVLLGLGADGHTASLFPGGPECEERSRWCLTSLAPEDSPPRERVTLSLPVLNAARSVAFLVAGEDKRDVLRELLSPQAAVELPAQRVRPSGELFCFSDLRL